MLTPDFVKGLDFTALSPASAGDHNTLVDGATPASDRGLVLWSVDTALNTPDVPTTPVTTTKWKRYLWLRIPHGSASSTVPMLYAWNDNATIVATYLKWQRFEADNSSVLALISALDLRVQDLEAVNVTLQALVNAANSNASTALTNSSAALSTANAANTNATTALSDLNTPTTGIKDRLTAVENRVTAAEANITAINVALTNINTTLSSGLGPQFIAPVVIYTGTAGIAYTTQVLPIPSTCKAVILQLNGSHNADASVLGRKNSAGSDYLLMRMATVDAARPAYRNAQVFVPCTTTGFDLFVPATSGTLTIQLIGYVL